MKKLVTLIAEGINVTARTQDRALAYLREDALQFRREWNYADEDVEDTDDDPADDAGDVTIEVSATDPGGRGERIWTGSARFSVVVEAAGDAAAYAAARALLAA